jgi:hypothetical protein
MMSLGRLPGEIRLDRGQECGVRQSHGRKAIAVKKAAKKPITKAARKVNRKGQR